MENWELDENNMKESDEEDGNKKGAVIEVIMNNVIKKSREWIACANIYTAAEYVE